MKNNLILNKKQDEFHLILSRFSHEIRNPIALINSEIQMIEDTHPEVVSFDYWNDITANLEYTKELLNNLSDYNNAHKLERKRTAFTAYLKDIISSIQPTYQYLGITLKTDISPSLPALFIDPVKLKQALLNLLRNAAEAISSADGKVKLCAFSSDQRVHIVITDNGCGSSLSSGKFFWQNNVEGCFPIGFNFCINVSAVSLDDLSGDCQPQSGSTLFECYKWSENFIQL